MANSHAPRERSPGIITTARTQSIGFSRTLADSGSFDGFSKYEIGPELGRGGMGMVRRATDRELRRELAIKVLLDPNDPDALACFLEESQITGQLEHPNIVPVHELGRDHQGRPWLAMKCVRGETLAQRIRHWQRRKATLSPESLREIIDIFQKVCDAVAFAHDHRVVHRDLKPDNIMMGEYGEVLLMDWGLAKPLDAPERARQAKVAPARAIQSDRRRNDAVPLTMDGDVVGTPSYMAPEQAAGRTAEVNQRSDIFALGAVLYHMVTLELPYDGKTVEAVLDAAIHHRIVPPRDRAKKRGISKALNAIIMKAMAHRPADRYASVKALQADLQAMLHHQAPAAYRGHMLDKVARLMRRHPTAFAASLLSVAFLFLLGMIGSTLAAQAAAAREQAEIDKREKIEEREARERAEHERALVVEQNKAKELMLLAQEGKIDELVGKLGGQLQNRRDHVIGEFYRGFHSALQKGQRGAEYIQNLGPQKTREFIDAFEALIHNHEEFGSDIPATPDDYFCLGGMYHLGLQNFDEALNWYTRCLEKDDTHAQARIARGLIYFQKNRFDLALADLEVANKQRPAEVPDTLVSFFKEFANGNKLMAIARIQAAANANLQQWDAWAIMGVVYQSQGRQEMSDKAFDQALRYCPPSAIDLIQMLRGFKFG